MDKVIYIGRGILSSGKIGFKYDFNGRISIFAKQRSKKTAIGSIIEIEGASESSWGIGNVVGMHQDKNDICNWIAEDKSTEIEYKSRNVFKRLPDNEYTKCINQLKHIKRKLHPRDRNNFAMAVYLELLKY